MTSQLPWRQVRQQDAMRVMLKGHTLDLMLHIHKGETWETNVKNGCNRSRYRIYSFPDFLTWVKPQNSGNYISHNATGCGLSCFIVRRVLLLLIHKEVVMMLLKLATEYGSFLFFFFF